MIQYSKYFADLGIAKKDILLPNNKTDDKRYHLNKETRMAEIETWNMDYTLALVTYAYIREFEPHIKFSTPMGLESEEWLEIYNKIKNGFELYLTVARERWLEEDEQKTWNEARHLLAEWWDAFWW